MIGAVALGGGAIAVAEGLAAAAGAAWLGGMIAGGIDAANGGSMGRAVGHALGEGGMAIVDGINNVVDALGWAGAAVAGVGRAYGRISRAFGRGMGTKGVGSAIEVVPEEVGAVSRWSPVFPENSDDFFPRLPREPSNSGSIVNIDQTTRVRIEQHQMISGETYNPRHHGQHYHVEVRTNIDYPYNKVWKPKTDPEFNLRKIQPPGYISGQGTGFIPGEIFLWEITSIL